MLTAVIFLFPIVAGILEHMASSLLMVSGLLGLFLIRRPMPKLSKWEWGVISGLAAFIMVAAISLINAADPAYGFRKLENLGKLLLFPVFLLGWRYLQQPPLQPFLYGLLVAGPVYLLTGLVQIYSRGMARAMGAYNPIVYGDLAILILAILGTLLIHNAIEQRLRIWTLFSMGSALVAAILSGTRGAWILLPVLAVAWVISSRHQTRKTLIYLGALLLVFLALFSIDLPGTSTIRERMADAVHDINNVSRGNLEDISEDQRILMWQATIRIWQDYPWLGIGLGGFRHYTKVMIAEGAPLDIPWTHAHNIYFEFLVTTGLVGLVVMIGGIFLFPGAFFLQRLRKASSLENRAAAMAALVALLAFAVFGLTESWLSRSPLLSTYIFCLLVFSVSFTPRHQGSGQKTLI